MFLCAVLICTTRVLPLSHFGSTFCVCVLGVPVGNALLLLVQSARVSEPGSVYMVIAILGIELLVALPCLLIYTGNQGPTLTFRNVSFYLPEWENLPAKQLAV